MGIYLNPFRVDLTFIDSLRNGKDKAWKRLLPAIQNLSVKEREPFEHFIYEDTLPTWHAVKYLQVARFFCRTFGAPLETGVWGIINHTSAYDIFGRISSLLKNMSLPVSLVDDIEQCSGSLWGMPIVDGVAIARMEPAAIKQAAKIVQKTFAAPDEFLRATQDRYKQYEDEPVLATFLRDVSFCYRVGHWSAEEFTDSLTPVFDMPHDLDCKIDAASAMLENVWGGEERASFLFDGAQKFFDWLDEASRHKQGLVFFVE